MKFTIETDDKVKMEQMLAADRLILVLHEIEINLRNRIKYRDNTDEVLAEINSIRDHFYIALKDVDVVLDGFNG